MLRYFLTKTPEDRSALFAGLAVASSEIARPHAQRYPVVFLTFKDVTPRSWEDCLASVTGVLAEAYGQHRHLLVDGVLAADDAEAFAAILHRRADRAQLVGALRLLSRLLAEHHREKVVMLIDEYDSPIHAGYTNRYYDDVITFFRDFLSGGLKDNEHLFKGVQTSSHASCARDRRCGPGRSDLADGGVAVVGDVDVAGAVDRRAGRTAESRVGARAVGAASHARGAGQRRPGAAVCAQRRGSLPGAP